MRILTQRRTLLRQGFGGQEGRKGRKESELVLTTDPDIRCRGSWTSMDTDHFPAADRRAIVAHGASRGCAIPKTNPSRGAACDNSPRRQPWEHDDQNHPSPGRGERVGFLLRHYLPPLPGFLKFAGDQAHCCSYGLLSRAAPQRGNGENFTFRVSRITGKAIGAWR